MSDLSKSKQTNLSKINIVSMTSLEIAEATGKRHDNVLTDIRKMINELGLLAPDFLGTNKYKSGKGRIAEHEIFILPKREVFILITGYSAKLRANVIDRLKELEDQLQEKQEKEYIRNQARLNNPDMNKALMDQRAEEGKDTKSFHYSNEANMINRIVLGMTAAEYRDNLSISPNDSIRDFMDKNKIKAIDELQLRNKIYLQDGLDYEERKELLLKYYNKHFKLALLSDTI